jgi:hypothetical protein
MSTSDEDVGGSREGSGEETSFVREKRTDDTWKEKAREEKEKLAAKERERAEEFPPASFMGLIDDFSFRAMIALGQIRPAGTEEVYIDLDGARYAIDLLEVLEQKTKGNLSREEESLLSQVLHNLRLLFVQVSRHVEAAAALHDQAGGPRGSPPHPAPSQAQGQGPRGEQKPPGGAPEEKPGPKIIL